MVQKLEILRADESTFAPKIWKIINEKINRSFRNIEIFLLVLN